MKCLIFGMEIQKWKSKMKIKSFSGREKYEAKSNKEKA